MFDENTSQQRFAAYQEKRRQELWGLLGDLPPKSRPEARVLKIEQGPGYTLERLELELNGLEPVPAYLLVPEKRQRPAPGLLYIHSHGDDYDVGKEELLCGLDVMHPYAPVCVEKGLVTLAIDSWCLSGRKHKPDGRRGEHDAFKLMLWRGQVLWGMMLFDEFQAVTYLQSRPESSGSAIILRRSTGNTAGPKTCGSSFSTVATKRRPRCGRSCWSGWRSIWRGVSYQVSAVAIIIEQRRLPTYAIQGGWRNSA